MKNLVTPEEFVRWKLSDAIEQVIKDVKKIQKLGIELDMSAWAERNKDGTICSVCLGGAAALSFTNIKKIKKPLMYYEEPSLNKNDVCSIVGSSYSIHKILDTFNHLRSGAIWEAAEKWYNRRLWVLPNFEPQFPDFDGHLSNKDIEDLIHALKMYAAILRVYDL